jgi:hypothetical protein
MVCNLMLMPLRSYAWGPTGHAYIGEAALGRLDTAAREQVEQILAPASAEQLSNALVRACFWPDEIRKTTGWEWSGPLHYVNIPRNSERYDRQRDCADGICVTEGIRKYAQQLTVHGLSPRQRWEALAWLCHLVADLHQPLHAGFRDDRGGNRIDIRFQGETVNLHRFWDGELVRSESAEVRSWLAPGANDRPADGAAVWNPASVDLWTEESHRIAGELAYPPGKVIEADFARQSLHIIREQWEKAASRLALILNAVLGGGRVEIGD